MTATGRREKLDAGVPFEPLLVVIFLLLYAATAKGFFETRDTQFSWETARALLTKGSLVVDCQSFGTLRNSSGECFSPYGIGLVLILLPFVFAGKLASVWLGVSPDVAGQCLASFYNVPAGVMAIVVVYRFTLLFEATKRTAALGAFVFGVGTLCWRYSVYDFSEATQMLLLLASVFYLVRGGRGDSFRSSVVMSGLILVKVVYVVYLPLLALYAAIRVTSRARERWQEVGVFIIGPLLSMACLAGLNWFRFSNPLETGYGQSSSAFELAGLSRIVPLLVSMDKGLFIFCPVLLVSLLGWKRFWDRRKGEALLFLAIVLVNLCVASTFHYWWGGACWGPRFLVPVIPFWFLPAIFVMRDTSQGWRAAGAGLLVTLSVAVQGICVLVRDQEVKHIRYNVLGPATAAKMPSELVVAARMLPWKLMGRDDGTWPLNRLGIDSNDAVDVSAFRTFRGLNLWSVRLADYTGRRWLAAWSLVLLGFASIPLGVLVRWLRGSAQAAATPDV